MPKNIELIDKEVSHLDETYGLSTRKLYRLLQEPLPWRMAFDSRNCRTITKSNIHPENGKSSAAPMYIPGRQFGA